MFTFILLLRNGIRFKPLSCLGNQRTRSMAQNRFHTRQAAAALLKTAQATSDRNVARRLIEAAADLQAQAGELPPPTIAKAPDIQTEG
jgi:hypothetical protein